MRTETMTDRERFLATMQFKPVDRLPFRHAYGLMPGVLEDWWEEGLPRSVQNGREAIYEYFGFPSGGKALPIDLGPRPPYPSGVIEETADYVIRTDIWGRTTKVMTDYASLPIGIKFLVKDWDSWLPLKERLQFSPDRIGDDLESVAQYNLQHGKTNFFGTMGFYWFPRDLMGDEALCIAYYEQPDLVMDIVTTWCDLIVATLKAVLERIELDQVHFGEDMAYKTASMVGPSQFDQFIRPFYNRVHELIEEHHIPVFSVDSDGNFNELIEWFIECGVNLVGPNEVNANNNIVEYRKRYGQKMAYDGGLDKRVLLEGPEAIDEMLQSIIPFMKQTGGGWIAALDHRVLRGTKLADFTHYVNRLKEWLWF